MATLLCIDASSRQEGSHCRAMADYFIKQWMIGKNPQGEIGVRDLIAHAITHISDSKMNNPGVAL